MVKRSRPIKIGMPISPWLFFLSGMSVIAAAAAYALSH